MNFELPQENGKVSLFLGDFWICRLRYLFKWGEADIYGNLCHIQISVTTATVNFRASHCRQLTIRWRIVISCWSLSLGKFTDFCKEEGITCRYSNRSIDLRADTVQCFNVSTLENSTKFRQSNQFDTAYHRHNDRIWAEKSRITSHTSRW